MFLGMSRCATKRTSGLVDAHAEGDGGDHDDAVFAQKAVLVRLAQARFQPGVVGQGVDAVLAQRLGDVFHLFARLAVDDARLARVFALDKAQQLLGRILLFDDLVADVGPVKAADKLACVFQLQALDDVGAGQRVRRGGQGQARHAGVTLVQHGELAVFGPEVVAPLADAVRLVNRKQAQLPALVQRIKLGQKARRGDALGRGVEQGDLAAQQALLDDVGLVQAQGGVEEGGFDPRLVQRADLVVHQRNQRRNHDADPVPSLLAGDGGDLVAQAFAAAGGH